MDFKFTPEQERFRQEVRDFLEEELARGTFKPVFSSWDHGYSREFAKKVGQKGWIGLTWPEEYGGQGRSFTERTIFYEEMSRYGAPVAIPFWAEVLQGPRIIAFGSEEQKKELIPKMLKGEIFITSGHSEPEAGYETGATKTRAVEDGDYFIINGQKVWSSLAQYADYYRVVTMTDPEAPKDKRYSQFLIPIDLPGITVRSIKDLTGHVPFCEGFFDEVRVHKSCMLGERGSLSNPYITVFSHGEFGEIHRLVALYPVWYALLKYVKETKRNGKPLSQDLIIRSKLAQLEIELQIGRLLCYRVAATLDQAGIDSTKEDTLSLVGVQAPMAKIFSADFQRHQIHVATEIVGLYGQLMPSPHLGPVLEMIANSYAFSRAEGIRGFPSEYHLSTLAERGLGLPSCLEPSHHGV